MSLKTGCGRRWVHVPFSSYFGQVAVGPHAVWNTWLTVQGLGFRGQGLGFRVQGSGFEFGRLGFKLQGVGYHVYIPLLDHPVSRRPLVEPDIVLD